MSPKETNSTSITIYTQQVQDGLDHILIVYTPCLRCNNSTNCLRIVQLQIYNMVNTVALLFISQILSHSHGLPTTKSTHDNIEHASKGWSTEAIIAVVGVLVAMICCVISLVWPRRWRLIGSRTTCNTGKLIAIHKAGKNSSTQCLKQNSDHPYKYPEIHRIIVGHLQDGIIDALSTLNMAKSGHDDTVLT
ncbi:uncharacterized protein M421DRAFT_135433 [Didymella exigua CBS 183.55]|uniref:Uncharacterized protein n=1 Tax=Didymella exigua CBS 183.55 TaxID=1150837 RepID=A0A6A5RQ26_9PLEO|nr:uncharacterized protein M421DRAFT_135433 [Didymella exigua CBS 183.55]KAF1929268.1 hypothetical protein M421DRAFT_135433 [Didymella exigua CBS 183.55]